MPYCKKCGAELPEYAMFCSKCGVENPLSLGEKAYEDEPKDQVSQPIEQTPQPITQENTTLPQAAEQPKDSNNGEAKKPLGVVAWIKENFLPLYVILGVVSIVLLQFSTMTSLSAFGFGVTLGVFAILCALAFFAVGAVKFFTADISANNNKHSTGDIICFALGIIGFVYVLVSSIVVLVAVSDLLESLELFVSSM